MSTEQVLWSRPPGNRRGPKPALSRERVVDAGIRVADRTGLGALTMQRVAAELGAATMTLYRHVPGRAELVALMFDRALGPPPALPSGRRDGIAEWARASRRFFLDHPWALPLATEDRAMGPHELAWTEAALRALADGALPASERFAVLLAVIGYVRGASTDPRRAPRPPTADRLRELDRAVEFPLLLAALAGPSEGRDPETEADELFEYGLGRLLDGLAGRPDEC